MKEKYIQVGVIGIRDPADRYKILKNIPIYEAVTPEHAVAEDTTHRDIARVFAAKMKQYIDGGGQMPGRNGVPQ